MKKIFLAASVLLIMFLPAALSLVLAQGSGTVSFHLTVVKKTTQGDGTFNFAIEKQEPLIPAKIMEFAKVLAFDITEQKNEFSLATANGSGVYDSDYEIAAGSYSYLKLAEESVTGWKIKSIVCNSNNEDFFYNASGGKVSLFNVGDGDQINCEFTNEKLKNPVLIVPGLLGTELYDNNNGKMWPNIAKLAAEINDDFMNGLRFDNELNSLNEIAIGKVVGSELFNDYTNNLINQLISSEIGYVLDETLFTFPYDWRYGVSGTYPDGITTNSVLLKEKIQEIRDQTGADKVAIIAHSLGGLVAKKYVMENSESYIEKLIFVGTPNLGSPIAAKAILAGHNFDVAVLSSGRIKDISGNMPAAHDLLPSFRYRDKITNYIKLAEEQAAGTISIRNLNFADSQTFLDDHGANTIALNQSDLVHNVNGLDDFDVRGAGVDAYKIVGCASGMPMQVRANIKIDGSVSYEPYSYISSDNTVPFGSADSIFAANEKSFYAIKSKHGAMMGEDGIRQTIANILAGSKLETGSNVIDKNQLIGNENRCALNGVAIKIYSPLDIVITDQNGKHLGLDGNNDPQNDIPGASFDVIDGHKFVYLPEGNGEQYQINLQGSDSGTFTLETQNVDNDVEKSSRVFENIAVTPVLQAVLKVDSDKTILSLDNDGDGENDEILTRSDIVPDIVAPVIAITSPQNDVTYLNNGFLAVSYVVSDNKSLPEKIITKVSLDGAAIAANQIDLAFQKTGNHILRIEARDEADNTGTKEVGFKVNATIDSIAANIKKFAGLGLIKKPQNIVLAAQIKALRAQFDILNKLKTDKKLPARAKNAAVKALEAAISRQLDLLIREIQKASGRGIDVKAVNLLVDSLKYIKIK